MRKLVLIVFTLCCALLAFGVAYAADKDADAKDPSKPDYKMDDVTVQGKTPKGSLDITSASVLGPDEIQGRIYYQAVDVVELSPGVVVYQNHRGGTAPGFTMRGFTSLGHGSPDATFYVDHIPLNFRYIMNTNIIIPLEINQVDILKGPVSALYGNYHSAGAVHYHTIQGGDVTRTQLRYGVYNTADGSMVVARENDGLSQVYAAQMYHSDGMREHSRYDRQNAAARWKYKFSDQFDLSLGLRAHNGDWDGPTASLPDFIYDVDRFTTTTYAPGGFWRFYSAESVAGWNISEVSRLELCGYGLHHDMGNLYQGYFEPDSEGLFSGALDEIANTTTGVSLTYTFKGDLLSRPANLIMGMEYRYETEDRDSWSAYKNNGEIKGPKTAEWDFTFETMSLFGQMDYRVLDFLRVVGGLRWDGFDGEADVHKYSDASYLGKHSTSDDLDSISPKLGVVVEPFERWQLFANYAQGFSLPTGINLFTIDDIKPARRQQWEVGMRTRPVQWLDFAISGYLMDTTDDLENIAEAGQPAEYVNAGETRRKGIEVEANLYPAENWRLHLNYSYIDARYEETDVQADKQYLGNHMTDVPEHVANAELRYAPPQGLGGRAWLRYVGECPDDKANQHYTDPYAIVDLQINYRFNERYLLALDVVNLFDNNYASSASYSSSTDYWRKVPGAPLGAYLTLTIDW